MPKNLAFAPPRKRPTTCEELAEYCSKISENEKNYIADKMAALLTTNEAQISEANWRDVISVLAINNKNLSIAWLNRVYDSWKENPNQPVWQKMAMIATILYAKNTQEDLLTAIGATNLLKSALNWLNDAEESLGRIPEGAQEEWQIILLLTSLLTVSFGVGVSKKTFAHLEKTLWKLKGNRKSEEKKLKKSLQDAIKNKSRYVDRYEGKTLNEQELIAYKNEEERYDEEIAEAELKYQRMSQSIKMLEVNISCLAIDRTRLQKWQEYTKVMSSAFDASTSAVAGAAAIAGGTSALIAAIAAVPFFGVGVGLLVLAVPVFLGSVVAGVAAGGRAILSAGNTLIRLHYLTRTADKHPVNELLADGEKSDFLSATASYYEGTEGRETLRKEMHGKDSWYAIQFLTELFVTMDGASRLEEALRPAVIKKLSTLLRVLYREHRGSKDALHKFVCSEVVYLSQTLMETLRWDLLLTLPKDIEHEVSREQWVAAYETSGWLYPLGTKQKHKEASKYREELTRHLLQSSQRKEEELQQPINPAFLPWDEWFLADGTVIKLYDACDEYLKSSNAETLKAVKRAYEEVGSSIRMNDRAITEGTNPAPSLSTWGRESAELIMDTIQREEILSQGKNVKEEKEKMDSKREKKATTATQFFAEKNAGGIRSYIEKSKGVSETNLSTGGGAIDRYDADKRGGNLINLSLIGEDDKNFAAVLQTVESLARSDKCVEVCLEDYKEKNKKLEESMDQLDGYDSDDNSPEKRTLTRRVNRLKSDVKELKLELERLHDKETQRRGRQREADNDKEDLSAQERVVSTRKKAN